LYQREVRRAITTCDRRQKEISSPRGNFSFSASAAVPILPPRMLREVKGYEWRRLRFFERWSADNPLPARYRWRLTIRRDVAKGFREGEALVIEDARREHRPVRVADDAQGRAYWLVGEGLYWTDEELTPADVAALLHQRQRRKQRQLDNAHAVMSADGAGLARREPIPRDVRHTVFARDRGRCVECGSNFDLQYDHVIPVAMGGASTEANLQLLCSPCNRAKGATLS
jgi:hypothetical protein